MRKYSTAFLLPLALFLAVLLSGCDILGFTGSNSGTFGYIGDLLSVDSVGHFDSEIVYDTGDGRWSFTPDGMYEQLNYRYEGPGEDWDNNGVTAEGWVLSYGSSGSYSYDPDTCVMTRNETSFTANGAWVFGNYVITEDLYFTAHTFGYAYREKADGTWESKYKSEPLNGSSSWFSNMSLSITSDKVTHSYENGTMSSTGSKSITQEGIEEYTVTGTNPAGVEFEAGKTVTFNLHRMFYKYREWDDTLMALGEWSQNTDQYSASMTIVHEGDFIFLFDASLGRGLEP